MSWIIGYIINDASVYFSDSDISWKCYETKTHDKMCESKHQKLSRYMYDSCRTN